MRIEISTQATKDFEALPKNVQQQADKQISYLVKNIRHPSLRAKKYKGVKNKWQARINDDYRFYFWIHEDIYFIVSIIKHPK